MKIIDRLMIRSLLGPSAGAFLAFLTLFLVGDLVSLGRDFLQYQPATADVLRYVLLQVIYMGTFFVPLCLMVGAFWGFCGLRQQREWIASLSSGRGAKRLLLAPTIALVVIGVGILGITWFALGETAQDLENLRDYRLRDKSVPTKTTYENPHLELRDGRTLQAQKIDFQNGHLTGVTVLEERQGSLYSRWDAQEVTYSQDAGWQTDQATVRKFQDGKLSENQIQTTLTLDLEPPSILKTVLLENPRTSDRRPEAFTPEQLSTLITYRNQRGAFPVEEIAHLHWKFSFPLSVILLGLLGALLGTQTELDKPAGLGVCLVGMFVFWIGHTFLFSWIQNLAPPIPYLYAIPYLAAYGALFIGFIFLSFFALATR